MSVARTQDSALDTEDEESFLDGIEPAELLDSARTQVTQLVTKHPVASLLGAFAIGFVVARGVRALGADCRWPPGPRSRSGRSRPPGG